jgi:regulator of sigma E protease
MSNLLMGDNPLAAILAFFVVLIPLILVHELGHFLAGKAIGVTILEFAIGFPPRIIKLFTWGETDFTLNWIPLGGYVRPLGEDMIRPLDEETVQKDREELLARQSSATGDEGNPTGSSTTGINKRVKRTQTVSETKPLPRIFFLAGGALANFILAFFLFIFVALSGVPQISGSSVYISEVEPNSVFATAGLQENDFILDVNGQNFNNSQQFWALLSANEGDTAHLTVQRGQNADEVEVNVPTADVSGQLAIQNYAQINGLVPDAPGDEAGIQPGDVVIAFNGELIDGVDGFRRLTSENAGQPITLTLQRGEETLDVELTPRVDPPEGQGAIGIVIAPYYEETTTGITYQEGFLQQTLTPLPLDQAAAYGANRIISVISTTVQIPAQLVSGALSAEEARPVSVIGMSQIGGQVIQQSIQQGRIAPILDFIAIISVALGFFNLLPIPALDGGRILFVLVEIVRGRPISPEREGLVHLVGLALLLSLSVIVILNDVANPITNMLR